MAWAIINPRFTPKHLVEEADLVIAGPLEGTANPLEWKLSAATQIKGKAAEQVLSLAACNKDHLEDIQAALKRNGRDPVILFSGTMNEEKRAYLHAMGLWLDLKPADAGRWDVAGYSPQMSGTYAGGTDMLIRMSRYLADDPDADVPVTAGVRWLATAKVPPVPGQIAGMAAVDFAKVGNVHLFVGSSGGDRLFRAKGEDALEDVTAAARLDAKSRRFAWLDLDGDGLADLVSWDGSALSARLAGSDGTFKPAGDGFSLKLGFAGQGRPAYNAECLGLAPCSTDGRPGLLVSTAAAPILLVANRTAGWTKAEFPAGPQVNRGTASPCVVADLDNDGYPDVLQPGEGGGLLWKGKAGGFGAPARVPVATGRGAATAAVGDFNQDGFLDVFLAGPESNSLWENDGKGGFRDVFRNGGSISYKCPPGATGVQAMDLNHDGRQDLCLVYREGELLYHWNRGFRSFGEEGEVRLPGIDAEPGQPRLGQIAAAAGDFNADGSSDLAVILTNGDLYCAFNDKTDVPSVRLRLAKGMTGPVTASCWIGEKHPTCTGALPVPGHSPAATLSTRFPGPCTIRFRLPGGPIVGGPSLARGEQSVKVAVEDGPKEVLLTPPAGP